VGENMVAEQGSISESLIEEDKAGKNARLIAFYLPQFHPTPENDEWWGKGFTEWTNVAKAKPLFPGHHQPNLPADLGFYDLRVPETRIAQAELAREHGIEGFCYWHYWFGNGKRILERPFNEVLRSGEPNFPFCLGWANHTWSGIWDGCPDRVLAQQTYPGKEDYKAHFEVVVEAFADDRYMKVHGKPIFLVFLPGELPNSIEFTDCWRELSDKAGFPGLYLIGVSGASWDPQQHGFDAFTSSPPKDIYDQIPYNIVDKLLYKILKKNLRQTVREFLSIPSIYKYDRVIDLMIPNVLFKEQFYPCIVPNWDNTPRSGINGVVIQGHHPELFRKHLKAGIRYVEDREFEKRIIFVKSWNEWAEGNYLEPDRRFGKAFLEVMRSEVVEIVSNTTVKNITLY
jgi:Glycosyltransferase WbsX